MTSSQEPCCSEAAWPVLIALGSNLPSIAGSPRETVEAALSSLARRGVETLACSRWFASAPEPPSGQPWFINGVARVKCDLTPRDLLMLLHAVEAEFGRGRREVNAARTLDLDLLAYGSLRMTVEQDGVTVPHPRLADRAFVLLPLADVVPDWHHPVTGRSIDDLIRALPPGQTARPLERDDVAARR